MWLHLVVVPLTGSFNDYWLIQLAPLALLCDGHQAAGYLILLPLFAGLDGVSLLSGLRDGARALVSECLAPLCFPHHGSHLCHQSLDLEVLLLQSSSHQGHLSAQAFPFFLRGRDCRCSLEVLIIGTVDVISWSLILWVFMKCLAFILWLDSLLDSQRYL